MKIREYIRGEKVLPICFKVPPYLKMFQRVLDFIQLDLILQTMLN